MANVIKHKRGSGSDPSASDLILGELSIRTDTGKLFTKMDSGAIAEIAGGGSVIATSMDNATLLLRADTTYVEYKGVGAASWWATSNICYASGNNGVFYIFNPYSSSTYSFMLGSDTGYAWSYNRTNKSIGVYKDTESITGIQISQQSSGTFTAGKIRTYGLRVDS